MNNPTSAQQFLWKPQPESARLVLALLDQFKTPCPKVSSLSDELFHKTGTRLIDWVETICVPTTFQFEGKSIVAACQNAGFDSVVNDQYGEIFQHPDGIFPAIFVGSETWKLTIKVEDVTRFMIAHQLDRCEIHGLPISQFRKICVSQTSNEDRFEFWAAERHGISSQESIQADWFGESANQTDPSIVLKHFERFRIRKRTFTNQAAGFAYAQTLIMEATSDLGVDWACDLFFAAEREYWQSRNHAARVQKMRQDVLGMGWANHDHHTYRCSRVHFANLISTLELLGFHCRERFFAGEQAGWGAQVLEQPTCGIVIFADVDLKPGEVEGDFAHEGLPDDDQLGTVGLWCALHGEAFLQAGMHHLECQFDFDAARKQLAEVGVKTMEPFTDFEILRQAFTEPEVWKVEPARIETALQKGFITQEQAEKFASEGVVGSHLEILERNDGYKGFNQAGISHIIKQTDPRTIGNN